MKSDLILWINGQHGIERMIDGAEWDIGRRIQNVKDELSSFNTKIVKGKTYWYQWITTKKTGGGRWKYIGIKDPRPKLNARIKQLEQMKNAVRKQFKGKIHAEIGRHLIVDPKKLKTPKGDSVMVSDVIREISGPSRAGRITK